MKKGFSNVKVVNTPTVKLADSEIDKPKPSLHLDSDNFKKVADWDVGKEYTLELKVKMTGKNLRNYKGDGNTCGEFEILNIKDE